MGSSLSVLDFLHVGSSLSLRSFARVGSSVSVFSVARFGSLFSLSVLDFLQLGSSLSLRSCVRLGSALSVMDFVQLGSSLSLRSFARIGASLSVAGHVGARLSVTDMLIFGSSNTYIRYGNSAIETYVDAANEPHKALSQTATGGTLHGAWTADAMLAISDRRVKKKVAPLYQTLFERMETARGLVEGVAAEAREVLPSDAQSSAALVATEAKVFIPDEVPTRPSFGAIEPKGVLRKAWEDTHVYRRGSGSLLSHGRMAVASDLAAGRAHAGVSWLLRELRPVSFSFRKGPESKHTRYGFMAQDLERVLPTVVRKIDGGRQFSVLYQDMVAVLALAAQSQEERVAQATRFAEEALRRVEELEFREEHRRNNEAQDLGQRLIPLLRKLLVEAMSPMEDRIGNLERMVM